MADSTRPSPASRLPLFAALALLTLTAPLAATPLSPFIDLQERGLTLVADGEGLQGWDGSPRDLTVTIGGTVRFALLYWAGRERPCTETPLGSGDCSGFASPFKDAQMRFEDVEIEGTVIGSETQPVSGGGPILNIGYFADVTSIVGSAGPGTHSFSFADNNPASNLWRLNGVSLLVAYTNAADSAFHRVFVWDGLDFAFGEDPTPGDNRVTAAATVNHGANPAARTAQLFLVLGDGVAERPDHVTVSNNPTLFNTLDSSSGAQWDSDVHSISIPANVSATTVQAHSAPAGSFPDSLLWEVVALRVQQLDAARPTCPITLNDPGPPARVEVTIRDTGSGLAEILVTRSENADTVVPPFTVGTNDPVVLSSTKIDQTKRARVEARVTDLAGNVAICDPILALVIRADGKPVSQTHADVPQAEDTVTITNFSPGLTNLDVIVNGRKYKVAGLADQATATLDVSAAMRAGDNTVKLIAYGQPGASANVMIWDGEQ